MEVLRTRLRHLGGVLIDETGLLRDEFSSDSPDEKMNGSRRKNFPIMCTLEIKRGKDFSFFLATTLIGFKKKYS